LSEAGEDFRGFLGLLPDAAIVFDSKGKILEVNGAAERLSGYERQDLIGADFKGLKLFTRQGRKLLKDNLDQRAKGEDAGAFEVEMWTAEEKSSWVEANTSQIQYEGKPAVVMTLRDITSWKEAEDRRKVSEQRFRSLVEHAGVPVGTTDLRGHFTYVNKAMADLMGYSIDEIVGQPFRRFVHPDDRTKVTRLFFNIILLRREPRAFESGLFAKMGPFVIYGLNPQDS